MDLLCVSIIVLFMLISVSSSQSQNERIRTLNSLKCTAPARNVIENILRGNEVPKGHYPWHAAIFRYDDSGSQYFCGGTLISSNSVLTAAHCLFDGLKKKSPDTLIVRFGITRLNFDGESHFVNKIVIHDLFNKCNYPHDIGIVRLKTTVDYTDYIRPVCLSNENFNIINVEGFIPGFGSKTSLNMACMPGRSDDDCKNVNGDFFNEFVHTGLSFCAGQINGTTISEGDSGGGLVFKRSGGWYIRGIASITAATAGLVDISKFPVFTDVQSHFQWIIANSGIDTNEEMEIVHPFEELSCSAPSGEVISVDSKVRNGFYPWHCTIFLPDGSMYGGTIIREDVILTLMSIPLWTVHFDHFNIKVGRRQQIDELDFYKVRSIKYHRRMKYPNQLVLIRLDRTMTFSNDVIPVCITNIDFWHADITEWIPGLKNEEITDNGVIAKNLNTDCSLGRTLEEYVYCADVAKNGRILRGTGLIYKFSNGYYVRGIYMAVIGFDFGNFDSSQVTDITYFYDWIQNAIQALYTENFSSRSKPIVIYPTYEEINPVG